MEGIYYHSKSDYVFSCLKRQILDGQLLPGERLVISNIAKELTVSEIPVRDAVARLTAEGLVTMGQHNRAVVSNISLEDLKDIIDMRILLEPLSSKLATPFITEETIVELNLQTGLMDAYLKAENYRQLSGANREFHNLIYRHCPNKLMVQMIEELYQSSSRVRAIFGIEHGRGADSNQEHKLIVEAIKERDADRVFELMTIQKRSSLQRFLEIFSVRQKESERGDG